MADDTLSFQDLMLDLGNKIRAMRKAKSMTLEEMAASSGLSVSFISNVERGKKKPSMTGLKAICDALDVEFGYLFPENTGASKIERDHIVRSHFRRKISMSRIASGDYLGEIEYMLSPKIDGDLSMILIVYEPGGSGGDDPVSHEGEEVGYVLSGELSLFLAGEVLKLRPGDSFGFSSETPHRYYNSGTERVEFILVNTPVAFNPIPLRDKMKV